MRSDRLLSMLLLLQAHGTMPAPRLAAELEVSVRTVYRDMESLSAAGVPVYAERGRNGGISILPDFRTDVTGMTPEEAQALFVLVDDTAHADLGLGDSLRSALRKLMAALPTSHRDHAARVSQRILIDPSPWGAPAPPAPELSVVQEAVFTDRLVSFAYRSRDSAEPLQRSDVAPLGLVGRGGSWYLVASLHGSYRMFRIDRMSAVVLGVPKIPVASEPALFEVWRDLDAKYRRDYSSVHVRVRVRSASLGLVLRVHERDLAAPVHRDGPSEWTIVELYLRSFGHAQSLLAFGPDLEVLSPEPLIRHLALIVDQLHLRNAGTSNEEVAGA